MTATATDVLFTTELRPNRSATPGAVHRLALILCVILIPAGMIFIYVGAWPVFGFLGLELVALIVLLKLHHRRGYMVERIVLTAEDLSVERLDPWGRRQCWSFQRHWVQVNLENADDLNGNLELRSHGKALTIGAFLTPPERSEAASTLRRALLNVCRPCAPQVV